jgi:hypothetical protein
VSGRAYRLAVGLILVAGTQVACRAEVGGAAAAPVVGTEVGRTETADGRSVTLSVSDEAPPSSKGNQSNRCWHVTESENGRVLGSTSACHGPGAVSATYVMGATVVVTTCASTLVAVGADPQHVQTRVSARYGMLLVPHSVAPSKVDSVAVACLAPDGSQQNATVIPVVG